MIPIGRGDVVAISDAMPSDEKRVAQSSRAAHTIRIPRASLIVATHRSRATVRHITRARVALPIAGEDVSED
jgi:hypothetical protein